MKSKRLQMVVWALISLFALTLAVSAQSNVLLVVTEPATDISATGAVLDGIVTTVYFRYSTSTGYYSYSTTQPASAGNGAVSVNFSAVITGLKTNTLYYCQAIASNSLGSVSGSNVAFVTGPPVAVTIQADQPGSPINSNFFGLAFEEINFAGEGGLYAELVRNRAFEEDSTPKWWSLTTNGTAAGEMTLDTSVPLNTNSPHALKLTMLSGSGRVGAVNNGFWGIPLALGAIYDLSFYARSDGSLSGPVTVRLEDTNGSTVYAEASVADLTPDYC